jgi:hypothetical protein
MENDDANAAMLAVDIDECGLKRVPTRNRMNCRNHERQLVEG